MSCNLLILGGTTEASALARAVAKAGVMATLSYAGRVARPMDQPIPCRTGGFGGVDGLIRYIRDNAITHVVDATHPFAAQMSRNAVMACKGACKGAAVPLVALTRPPWAPEDGDDWRMVADVPAAVDALAGPPRSVMLALGRLNVPAFADMPQHRYLLRLVDPPDLPLPLPNHDIVLSRGPFTVEGDTALMRRYAVELVVCKNAGGTGAEAKLRAARELGIPVVMIARPPVPERTEVTTVADVLAWLGHSDTERGV